MSLKGVRMSFKQANTSLKGVNMSLKGAKASQMESVRLEINGHMSSVGEQILCVLDKHDTTSGDDVCRLRVFVLERLSAAAQFMYSLFQREMDTLLRTAAVGGIGEKKKKEIKKRSNGKKKTEEVPDEQQERSTGLVQAEPQPPRIKKRPSKADGSTLTSLEAKSAHYDENRETEPVAGTSTETHVKTQAGVEDCGTAPLSDSSESDAEDTGDDWAETREGQSALNELESDETQNVDGDDEMSQDLNTLSTRSYTGKTSFICSYCGKTFCGKSDLKRHTMIHTGEKPFNCTVCGKSFIRTHHLKRHALTHRGEKPRRDRKATSKRSLTGNQGRQTQEKQTFPCSYCDKLFTHKKRLKRHTMIHTGEKPCQDLRTTSMRSPTEKKSFLCSYCGKMFTQKSDLERHTMLHTGEKPCKCAVCGKGFIRMLHLKIHEMVHTGEKPITCTVCGKGFIRMHHLKRHQLIHTGERSFNCRICGKDFSRKDYIKTHMKTHTVGENVENALV